jgi:NADPH:quinone reductase-like Zn-dependent oxidoreductase
MKAVQIEKYGDASVVSIQTEVPEPSIRNDQVLVEVHAAGLNPIDWKIRFGYLKQMFPLQFPVTLGIDLAGVIVKVGPHVRGFRSGDRVYGQAGLTSGGSGAFAEYAATAAGKIAKMPPELNFIEAASLPLNGVSALQAIDENIKLRAGQKILIHGGAGGIGSMAIQLSKYRDAYVATTVQGGMMDYVRNLGADEVIDFMRTAFEKELKGYDAVLDTVGGETYQRSFIVLKEGGIILSMTEPPATELVSKYGVTALTQLTDVNTIRLDRVSELVRSEIIIPQVQQVFSLGQAKEAFLAREESRVHGKVVLKVR